MRCNLQDCENFNTRSDVLKKKLQSGVMVYFVPHINKETGLPSENYDYCSPDEKINAICEGFNDGKPRAVKSENIWRVVKAIEEKAGMRPQSRSSEGESKEAAYQQVLKIIKEFHPMSADSAIGGFLSKFTRFRGINLKNEPEKFINLIVTENPELTDKVVNVYIDKVRRKEHYDSHSDARIKLSRMVEKIPALNEDGKMQSFLQYVREDMRQQAAQFYLMEQDDRVAKSATDYDTTYFYVAHNADSYKIGERLHGEFPKDEMKKAYMSLSEKERSDLRLKLSVLYAECERKSQVKSYTQR